MAVSNKTAAKKPATSAKTPATKAAAPAKAAPSKAAPSKAAKPTAAKPAAEKKDPPKRAAASRKSAVPAEQRRNYVEVAAYYIAERHGFTPGRALEDWAAAEAEIDRLLAEGLLNP